MVLGVPSGDRGIWGRKRKYPEEHLTVDKVGREKTCSVEVLFCVELMASSSKLDSTLLRAFL